MSKKPKRGWFDYAVFGVNLANLVVRFTEWLYELIEKL